MKWRYDKNKAINT